LGVLLVKLEAKFRQLQEAKYLTADNQSSWWANYWNPKISGFDRIYPSDRFMMAIMWTSY